MLLFLWKALIYFPDASTSAVFDVEEIRVLDLFPKAIGKKKTEKPSLNFCRILEPSHWSIFSKCLTENIKELILVLAAKSTGANVIF